MKQTLLITLAIAGIFALGACKGTCTTKGSDVDTLCNIDPPCCDPEAIIYLQPYEDFTQSEAYEIKAKLLKVIPYMFVGADNVEVLPNRHLPKNAYYKPRNRYLAHELLKDLKERPQYIEYVVGLTHKDISYKIHGYENYGIMGLTPLGHHKSIVSDYRVKGDEFISVILHEFGHGFWALKHCEDQNCLMCDYSKLKKKRISRKFCSKHEYVQF